MRRTKDIPDAEWGVETPTIDEWMQRANAVREAARQVDLAATAKRQHRAKQTFKTSADWLKSFNLARHQVLKDIGVQGNTLTATLANGRLVIEFFEDVLIEPSCHGAPLDYHTFTDTQTLDSLHSFIMDHDGLSSCILAFGCDNGIFTFEYLITPQEHDLAFEMTYLP